jgi:hypothetical protein
MANIWLPGDFTTALREPNLLIPGKKPVGAVKVNKNHPLYRKLKYLYLPGEEIEIVGGFKTSTLGSGATVSVDAVGRHVQVDNTENGKIELDDSDLLEPGANGGDISYGMQFKSNSASRFTLMSKGNNNSGTRLLFIDPYVSSTETQFLLGDSVGNWVASNVTCVPKVGVVNSVVATLSPTSPKKRISYAIPKDGTPASATTDVGHETDTKNTSDPFRLGAWYGSAYSMDGNIYLFAVFSPHLTEAEEKLFNDNPEALLAPANDSPYFINVSAGSGTTISATPATATASGVSATVNAGHVISGSPATATATGISATVSDNTHISGSPATAQASGVSASINAKSEIPGSVATSTASGVQATVVNDAAGATTIVGVPATATVSGVSATVNDVVSVSGSPATATASGVSASINAKTEISASVATAQAAGVQATIDKATIISATPATVTVAGVQATVTNISSAQDTKGGFVPYEEKTHKNIRKRKEEKRKEWEELRQELENLIDPQEIPEETVEVIKEEIKEIPKKLPKKTTLPKLEVNIELLEKKLEIIEQVLAENVRYEQQIADEEVILLLLAA